MNDTIYAEDVGHYWKTGTQSPDTLIEATKKLIASIDGEVTGDLMGTMDGKAAIMLMFVIGTDAYKIIWPVLPSRTGDTVAAKRQAASAMWHDVKAKVVSAKFRGIRGAFHEFLSLPDGRIASQLTAPELMTEVPGVFLLPAPNGGHHG